MIVGTLIDTALNSVVFAFIGLLVWLYLREEDST
jgi:hypothetical protein